MGRLNTIQTNFTSGEVSPSMYGRVDVAKYANGVKTLENMIVRPQGGAYRRPGTKFLAKAGWNAGAAPDGTPSGGKAILIPFSFNTTQNYIVEIADDHLVIFKNGLYQDTTGAFTGTGQAKTLAGVWSSDLLSSLRWCQSADTLFICHPMIGVQALTRNISEVFALDSYTFEDGPYLSQDQPDTVYLSAYTHTGTLTVQTGVYTFVAGDINKYIEFKQDGTWKLGKITAVASTTECTVTLFDNLLTDLDASVRMSYWFRRTHFVDDIFEDPSPFHPLKPGDHAVVGGGNVTANIDVFKRSDRGKYVRDTGGVNEGTWALITAFTDSKNVVATALTMKTGTTGYPTDTLILTSEVRSCVASVKTGGTDGLGTNYFRVLSPITGESGSYFSIGRHVRFNFSGFTCWGIITTSPVDLKAANILLQENLPGDFNDGRRIALDGIPTSWKLGAWGGQLFTNSAGNTDVAGPGYPRVPVFHEQRLCFGGTYSEPQTVWASRPNDYGNFSPTDLDSQVTDENAITYTVLSRQVNEIQWMESGPVLLIGTSGGEWQVKAASNIAAPLTPSNISVTPQGTRGSLATVRGRRIDAAVLYVDRSGRKVRHLQYNFELDQFISKDLTILSDHILKEGGTKALRTAYQQEPHSLYWVVLADGRLGCLTYEPDQEVYAWSKHRLGGSGLVEDIAVITNDAGTMDQVYMVVKRTIGGVDYRYIERLNDIFDPANSSVIESQAFLDSSIEYSGASVTTVGGLTHLIGETVRILGNGMDLGNKVVNGSGQVTGLSTAVTQAWIGYQQTPVIETLNPEAPSPQGTAQGKVKRIHRLQLRIRNSRKFTAGDGTTMDVIDPTKETGLETAANTLFTGDVPINLQQAWGRSASLRIEQPNAYNLEITAIMPVVTTNE